MATAKPTQPVVSREASLALLREQLPVLRERFGVVDLFLFGSTARDEASPDSDVDLLVTFGREPDSSWGCYAAQSYLAELFGRRVDMVERHRMRQEYMPWVEADAVNPERPRLHMPDETHAKRWDVYVEDMLEHCQYVVDYTNGLDFDQYMGDQMRRLAVERSFGIVGEAANKIPKEVRDSQPDMAWAEIIGLRHRIVHDYGGIDHSKIWEYAQSFIPPLMPRLTVLLEQARSELPIDAEAPEAPG